MPIGKLGVRTLKKTCDNVRPKTDGGPDVGIKGGKFERGETYNIYWEVSFHLTERPEGFLSQGDQSLGGKKGQESSESFLDRRNGEGKKGKESGNKPAKERTELKSVPMGKLQGLFRCELQRKGESHAKEGLKGVKHFVKRVRRELTVKESRLKKQRGSQSPWCVGGSKKNWKTREKGATKKKKRGKGR